MQDQNLERLKNTSGFLPLSDPVENIKRHHESDKGPKVRNRLAAASNRGKESFPSDFAKTLAIRIPAEPDKHRFTDDMVKRHKAPVTRVFRIVAIVTHHPVVILFKRVLGYRF
jgi:hypothetical protein